MANNEEVQLNKTLQEIRGGMSRIDNQINYWNELRSEQDSYSKIDNHIKFYHFMVKRLLINYSIEPNPSITFNNTENYCYN